MDNATPCSVPGCSQPVKRRGYCYGHYMKAWRYGTPTPQHEPRYQTDLVGRRFGSLVVTSQRDGRHWICDCDCGGRALATRDGLLDGRRIACGDRAKHYRSDTISYSSAHDRIEQDRGRASDLHCVDCDKPAREWSYDHLDADERIDPGTGASFSLDPEHYEPRCVRCHRIFDDHPFTRGVVVADCPRL